MLRETVIDIQIPSLINHAVTLIRSSWKNPRYNLCLSCNSFT